MTLINQRKLEDQTTQFLHGLNEQYHNIKSHVLLLEPIPLILKIFSLVVQQDHQLVTNTFVTNINSVFSNVNANRNPNFALVTCKIGHIENVCFWKNGFSNKDDRIYKYKNNKKICTYCGMNGHIVENYYNKHGYPPGYKFSIGKSTQINSSVSIDDVLMKNVKKGRKMAILASLLCNIKFSRTFLSKVEAMQTTKIFLIKHK